MTNRSPAVAWRRPHTGVAMAIIVGVAVGCAPLPEIPAELPPAPSLAGPYRLQPGDQLDIKFFYNPELNEQVTVQPDGRFTIPLARDVMAAGRTLDDITKVLTEQYARELRDPAITVQLRSALPSRVYVGGEVAAPGEYVNVGPPLTVVQAIARAGGLKNSANQEKLLLVRRTPDGGSRAYGIDYVEAVAGLGNADVPLEPYDTVFVPRSGVANVYLAYQQYVQQFLPASFSAGVSATP